MYVTLLQGGRPKRCRTWKTSGVYFVLRQTETQLGKVTVYSLTPFVLLSCFFCCENFRAKWGCCIFGSVWCFLELYFFVLSNRLRPRNCDCLETFRLVDLPNLPENRAPELPELRKKNPGCGRNTTQRLLGTTSLASSHSSDRRKKSHDLRQDRWAEVKAQILQAAKLMVAPFYGWLHPRKLKWNPRITDLQRKSSSKPPLLKCSMLIFRGVDWNEMIALIWGRKHTSSGLSFSSGFSGSVGCSCVSCVDIFLGGAGGVLGVL